jgi:Asp-tRNA(Asn)/Glu-tRNA(Gln) amidotransferase C subunit
MPTRAEVQATARLARLALDSEEIDRMVTELSDIVARIGSLDAGAAAGSAEQTVQPVDDDGAAVPPAIATSTEALLRPDVVGPDPLHVPPSYIAPDWRDGFFTVPRLRTHDPDGE